MNLNWVEKNWFLVSYETQLNFEVWIEPILTELSLPLTWLDSFPALYALFVCVNATRELLVMELVALVGSIRGYRSEAQQPVVASYFL